MPTTSRPSSICRLALWGVALCFGGISGGCAESNSNLKAPASDFQEIKPDTTGKRSISAFQSAIDAREAAGDSALTDAQRLRAAFTDSIAGYNLEIDLADTLQMPLSTMIEVKRVFYNAEGDYIELVAGDYVRDPEFMLVNLHRHNLADAVEIEGILDDRRTVAGLLPAQAKDAFTWSSYNRPRRSASVYIGLDHRYFFTVEATAQDSLLDLGRVAAWLRWDGLYAAPDSL